MGAGAAGGNGADSEADAAWGGADGGEAGCGGVVAGGTATGEAVGGEAAGDGAATFDAGVGEAAGGCTAGEGGPATGCGTAADALPPDTAVGGIAAAEEGCGACASVAAAGRAARSDVVTAVAAGAGGRAEGSADGTVGISQSTVTAPSAKAKMLAVTMRNAGRTQSAHGNVARRRTTACARNCGLPAMARPNTHHVASHRRLHDTHCHCHTDLTVLSQ